MPNARVTRIPNTNRTAVVAAPLPTVSSPEWIPALRILVKFPTRSRPYKFFTVLEQWMNAQKSQHSVKYLVTIDADDHTMTCQESRDRLAKYNNVEVEVSNCKSKIEAINFGLGQRDGYDILVVASDDMHPKVVGWDARVAQDMFINFPAMDGAIHYPDGFRRDIITLSILGRNLYRRFGYIYHPDYISLWCDDEFTHVVKELGRYCFVDLVLMEHIHPANVRSPRDHLMLKNDSFFRRDGVVYRDRLKKNFDIRFPKLSLLIPSLYSRATTSLVTLLAELNKQIFTLPNPWDVEILVRMDDGKEILGDKRNRLLDASKGQYLAFIDDDDAVSPDYVSQLVGSMETQPDCISFNGVMTVDGDNPKPFFFSKDFDDVNEPERYLRRPNHLCAIRNDIAKSVRFPSKLFGEDSGYAAAIAPFLKREVKVEKMLYFYQFSRTNSATHV